MSESTENASGQEAVRRKGKEAPVEQSPVVSMANVTSSAIGAWVTAVFVAEKGGTSTLYSSEGSRTTSARPTHS
jgi:hypothetical protein